MAILGKKSSSCPVCCIIAKWVVCILLFLAAVVALIGVYQTHLLVSDAGAVTFQFGTTSGSLSIIAFVVAVIGWTKQMACCMSPCGVCSK